MQSLAAKGWKTSSTQAFPERLFPTLGGFDGTYAIYGHVAFVEAVNSDGTFLVSECNYLGIQDRVHYRVLQNASYYTFATK